MSRGSGSRVRAVLILGAVVCALAGPTTAGAADGSQHGAHPPPSDSTAAGEATPSGTPAVRDPWAIPGPAVFFECDNTHRSRNDPIVFPGRPGAAHRHVFFGSRRSNAFSTLSSLLAGRSGCDDARNTSAYWFPEP